MRRQGDTCSSAWEEVEEDACMSVTLEGAVKQVYEKAHFLWDRHSRDDLTLGFNHDKCFDYKISTLFRETTPEKNHM